MNSEKLYAKIPYFDGQHYDHWSELMENLLRAKGLWNLVKIGVEEPIVGTVLTNAQLKQLEKLRTEDHKVKHYLFKAIDRLVFEQILDRSMSKIVWDSLKRKFGGNDRVKKSMLNALRREFKRQCPLMNFKALWWSMSRSSNELAEMMSKYSRWRVIEAEAKEEEEDHTEVVDVEEDDNPSPKQLWSASSVTIWVISNMNVPNGTKKQIMQN
ncbi:hypothetical protein CR513_25552, partial [Mucuna pruriens]